MVGTMNSCKCKQDCIACGNKNLISVLDLGKQPLANSFKKEKNAAEEYYPLAVNFCANCSHLQLTHLVDADKLFKHYLYVSGTSKTQLDYFKWFVDMVSKKINRSSGKVLDIGCNDGSQLNYFKDAGFITYGVDPAANLHELSAKNHNVICDYFNNDSVIFDSNFDVIVCQNAFAHNYNQVQFLSKCKNIMNDSSLLFITISQATMVQNSEFDTIYHEHYSYYTVKSMDAICKRSGLFLVDVVKHDIHGNSYIFVISKTNNRSAVVDDMIREENLKGMSNILTYLKYANNAKKVAHKFKFVTDEMKKNGCILIGYGSPAKGNTMLNYSGAKLDFIVDDNPLKQGTFTPGSSIPVVSMSKLEEFSEHELVCFIPLAWNFFDEIYKKISTQRKNMFTLYMQYFPEFNVFAED